MNGRTFLPELYGFLEDAPEDDDKMLENYETQYVQMVMDCFITIYLVPQDI